MVFHQFEKSSVINYCFTQFHAVELSRKSKKMLFEVKLILPGPSKKASKKLILDIFN